MNNQQASEIRVGDPDRKKALTERGDTARSVDVLQESSGTSGESSVNLGQVTANPFARSNILCRSPPSGLKSGDSNIESEKDNESSSVSENENDITIIPIIQENNNITESDHNNKRLNNNNINEKKRKRYQQRRKNSQNEETKIEELAEKYHTIKMDKCDFFSLSPFQIQRKIHECVGEPVEIKKLTDGLLGVKVNTKEQLDKLKTLENIEGKKTYIAPNDRLNKSWGIIYSPDLYTCQEDELLEHLKSQDVIKVERFKKKIGDTLQNTNSIKLTFKKTRLPEFIKAAYLNIKVRPYIPLPRKCFNCQKFGHTAAVCRNEKRCECGKVGHKEEEPCNSPFQCPNCQGSHKASSKECPTYKSEKEIIKIKTIYNKSYKEAKEIVSSKSYVNDEIKYSEKAKPKPPLAPLQPTQSSSRTYSPSPTPRLTPNSEGCIWDYNFLTNTREINQIHNPSQTQNQQLKPWMLEQNAHLTKNNKTRSLQNIFSYCDDNNEEDEEEKKKKKKGWPKGKPRKPQE